MLLLAAIALGFYIGWRRAGQRGGDRLDRLQYGTVHAIVLALAVLVLTILVQRLALI